MEVSDMCLYVMVDGKMCVADLTEIDHRLVINALSTLYKDGAVKLVPLKGEYKTEKVGDSVDKEYVRSINE